MKSLEDIANGFSKLPPKAQKQLLTDTVENMIENREWLTIAKLLVDQLGPGDTDALITAFGRQKEKA